MIAIVHVVHENMSRRRSVQGSIHYFSGSALLRVKHGMGVTDEAVTPNPNLRSGVFVVVVVVFLLLYFFGSRGEKNNA